MLVVVWKVIIVSALSLSLKDKERLSDWEIDREREREKERAWQNVKRERETNSVLLGLFRIVL